MKVMHDPEHDLSYIALVPIGPGEAVKQIITGHGDVILDLDARGHLIGIELLRGHLLHPTLMAKAVPPGS